VGSLEVVMRPYEKLKQYWARNGDDARNGEIEEAAIAALERRYSVALPEDFRAYLRHAPSQGNETLDYAGIDWWDIGRIKNIPDEYSGGIQHRIIAREAPQYLFFADFAIWCFAWAINCGEGANRGRVVCIAGEQYDDFVADSFGEVVDLYIEDYRSVGP
jgi:hypothetical protein